MSDPAEKKAVSIKVPSKDPERKDDTGKDGAGGGDGDGNKLPTMNGASGSGDSSQSGPKKGTKKALKGGKDAPEPEELSEEDKALKEGLELAVARVEDPEPGIGKEMSA